MTPARGHRRSTRERRRFPAWRRSPADLLRPTRGGYATVELALTVPVVVLLLGAALWGVRVAAERLGCLAAAQAGAFALLRGEPAPSAIVAASADAPAGAAVRVVAPVAGHAGLCGSRSSCPGR